jgi:hypothetical protein
MKSGDVLAADLQPDKRTAEAQPAPDANRLRLARDWIAQARGKSLRQIYEERRGLPESEK